MSTSGARRSTGTPPTWAGGAVNTFAAGSSRYNNKAGNKERVRAGVGLAGPGLGILDVVVVGDSLPLGYNGVGLTQDSSKAWPAQFAAQLSTMLGGAPILDPITPCCGQDDQWVLTGAATRAAAPAYVFCTGAGTATRVTKPGTSVTVWYSNASTATTSFTIDGGAANNCVPIGGNTIGHVTVNGLPNTAHTIVWTSTTGSNLLAGAFAFGATTGIRVHNLCLGGSSAAFGTTYTNWSDHTSAGSLQDSRVQMLTDAGIVPQLVLTSLLGNDAVHSVAPATAIAGLSDVLSRFPSSDIALTSEWNVTPVTPANFVPYQTALYAKADAIDCQLFDIGDVIQTIALGIADGLIGPDNIHPTYALSSIFGRQNALNYFA